MTNISSLDYKSDAYSFEMANKFFTVQIGP